MTDSEPRPPQEPPAHEPMFNAPPMSLLFPVLIVAGYGLQVLMGPQAEQALVDGFGLNALLLRQGLLELLITYQFLHGGWTHAVVNAVFCLAFATPIVRAFGKGGWPSYILFYLLCGIVAGLGYCLLNWRDGIPIIGASGAISGLMGAAMRLRGDGRLNGFFTPRVATMTVAFIGLNFLSSFMSMTPGAGNVLVAWQAHIFGYLAGLLLIGPWLHLFHRRYFTTS